MRFLLIYLLSIAACSGGGGSDGTGGGSGGGTAPTSVAQALGAMGVTIESSPRLDDDQDPLPDDYSPLGSACTLNKFSELMLLGIRPDAATSNTSFVEVQPSAGESFRDVFDAQPATAWGTSENLTPTAVRHAVASDIDCDGLEETVIVYKLANDPFVRLEIRDDKNAGFAVLGTDIVAESDCRQLFIVSADFDGDGPPDIAIAVVQQAQIEVIYFRNTGGQYAPTGQQFVHTRQYAVGSMQCTMAAGNLDYDGGAELAVVINERANSNANPDGSARYVIYDDANRGQAVLKSGAVSARINSGTVDAMVADVALGDVDGDGVDEVVFGGLTELGRTSTSNDMRYLVLLLDDADRSFQEIDALTLRYFDTNTLGLKDNASGTSRHMRYAHVNTVDLDGDLVAEFHVNNVVYSVAGGTIREVTRLPFDQIVFEDRSGNYHYDWNTTCMVVADVTGDKRPNIISYAQTTMLNSPRGVTVWGDRQTDSINLPVRMHTIPTNLTNSSTIRRPVLVPVNYDTDSAALEFSRGSHQLVYTEPIIVAAIAAPPCDPRRGQNSDACRSTYGIGRSQGASKEESVEVTAGVTAGFGSSFSAFGVEVGSAEMLSTAKVHAGVSTSSAYTLTRRVFWQTGPMEDSVIFATLPLDQYVYRVLSHPNPDLIGTEVVISLPRRPVTILTTTKFYNQNAAPGGPRIGSAIFGHTPGELESYPTETAKNVAIAGGGLASLAADVGQGGGVVGVEISVYEESGIGVNYGASFETEVKGSVGGVIGGFSVGTSFDASLRLSRGRESLYAGQVGQMSAGEPSYSFGLFTFIHEDTASGQEFEVISYWVK